MSLLSGKPLDETDILQHDVLGETEAEDWATL